MLYTPHAFFFLPKNHCIFTLLLYNYPEWQISYLFIKGFVAFFYWEQKEKEVRNESLYDYSIQQCNEAI